MLRICRILIEKCQEELKPNAYRIFKCILSLLSIVENDELRQQVYLSIFVSSFVSISKFFFSFQCQKTFDDLASVTFGFSSISPLYETFAVTLLEELKTSSSHWLRSSRDRFLFETFVMQSGRSNRLFLKEIVEILINVMQPDRDSEVRNQCLLIIAHLLQFIDDPNEDTSTLSPFLTVLIDRCIMPNMQWKAGRTAAAIRATAIATLWSLFQAKSFRFDQVKRNEKTKTKNF